MENNVAKIQEREALPRRVSAIRKFQGRDKERVVSSSERRAVSARSDAVRLGWLWELVCDLAILDTHVDRVVALKHSSNPLQGWHHDWLLEKGILSYTPEEKVKVWRSVCADSTLQDYLGQVADLRKAAAALKAHRVRVSKVRLVENFLLGAFRSGVDVPGLLRPYVVKQ